jgi:mono/diheme cytochrome c family protein
VRSLFLGVCRLILATTGLLRFSDALLAASQDPIPGLALVLRSGPASDHRSADVLALFVPSGQPASPFLPAGPVSATWTGALTVDLRGDYTFHAAYNGRLKLQINDSVVLDSEGKSPAWIESPKVRLNKGANRIVAEYSGPQRGDSEVRVYWSAKEVPFNPIPISALSHPTSAEIERSDRMRKGRDLFADLRCIRCHAGSGSMPELSADAPTFTGIGSRRQFGWMARWIAQPASLRSDSAMPGMFHGPDAVAQSEAIAAFLSSLKSSPPPSAPATNPEAVEAGRGLYEKLHCVACHVAPDASETSPGKISQKGIRSKFSPGALSAFLRKPSEHYAWIQMPDFKLTAQEATQLAAYLESVADQPSTATPPTDESILLKGKSLVANSGCLNCHTLDLPNTFRAKALADLKPESWTSGCLAETPSADSKAPRFELSASDRAALAAFGRSDRSSLNRHTAADFLERHSVSLHCRECHGKFEGFPAWDLLGGKLKPDWASRFISGMETRKPRPWLESRMPAFPTHAAWLAQGLATAHGLPPVAPPDDPADADLAKVGHQLVGSSGGFACISCHSVGEFGATQVFEAPGINLALSHERLQPDFFRRWLRNPVSIDPNSKMPAYFDEEGRSALSEVLGGDGPKTIRALWEYIRLGSKMPKPE